MKKIKLISFGLLLIIVLAAALFTSCKKEDEGNTHINADGVTGTVTDIDGNTYAIVKIGEQWWMAENLKVTKYKDGTSIPNITDATEWSNDSIGAYCSYNNDADNGTKYGMLYNWYAVNTGKLAPAGWHVATNDEWTTLNTYVTSNTGTSGSVAKALAATSDWTSSTTTGAPGNTLTTNNSTGFSALPGGFRDYTGSFYYPSIFGYWWSATEISTTNARYGYLYYSYSSLDSSYDYKEDGFSVRCVMD